MTYSLSPSIVTDVSAMLVAKIIFLDIGGVGEKTSCWCAKGSVLWSGKAKRSAYSARDKHFC